jgi:hypothetical protein
VPADAAAAAALLAAFVALVLAFDAEVAAAEALLDAFVADVAAALALLLAFVADVLAPLALLLALVALVAALLALFAALVADCAAAAASADVWTMLVCTVAANCATMPWMPFASVKMILNVMAHPIIGVCAIRKPTGSDATGFELPGKVIRKNSNAFPTGHKVVSPPYEMLNKPCFGSPVIAQVSDP